MSMFACGPWATLGDNVGVSGNPSTERPKTDTKARHANKSAKPKPTPSSQSSDTWTSRCRMCSLHPAGTRWFVMCGRVCVCVRMWRTCMCAHERRTPAESWCFCMCMCSARCAWYHTIIGLSSRAPHVQAQDTHTHTHNHEHTTPHRTHAHMPQDAHPRRRRTYIYTHIRTCTLGVHAHGHGRARRERAH